MVRFSCFHTNLHSNRSKKEVQQSSAEAMSKASEDYSHSQWMKVSGVPNSSPPILFKATYDSPSNTNEEQDASSSREHCQESGEMHSDSSQETNIQVHQKTGLKKSQSLGSALEREGRVTDSEDEFDQDFPCDRSDEKNYARLFEGVDRSNVEKPFGCKDHNTNLHNKHGKALVSESYQGNNEVMGNVSIFSIEESKQFEEGDGDMSNRVAYEYAGDSGQHSPASPPILAKSCSFPDFGLLLPVPNDGSPSHVHTVHRCRSSEDLNALDEKRKAMEDQDRDNGMLENTKDGDRYEYESYCNHGGKLSLQNLNALHSKDFKIKRIEEWVSTIDLEDSNSLQEKIESSRPIDTANKGSYVLGSASSTAKMDSKSTHGMEAAKKYVSTLRATSTSAQLANLGLAVVPFLSAFVSLKTLNLSGNAIVRITSGALPRGLHVLNLSKNNISTIEGLRELTRLRVLDLSYNRILRIGHGLASCSSLKELYLAGNKISEVEGLHRLLKLNVLDLRFNKISTAKCLGQLAANYSSLQAINLEGNPAQRNVGDEHLKKYLQSILPHLVYFNKQTVRASSSKEVVDRSTRSAISSHPLDRGSRSDHKLVRKGSHPLPLSVGKTSSSSHGHRAQAVNSSKQSKDRHGRLPPNPSGIRGSHRHNYLDIGSKLQELRSNLSLRRTRSEGNLGDS